ncbi:hypothetical protein [Streptomyces sp. R33]|uniref:Uncharacterized protein n=1 Tax=Streptomyces sp. R33 TaxID=3238629 RepID=A0AB39Y063_9ACTN
MAGNVEALLGACQPCREDHAAAAKQRALLSEPGATEELARVLLTHAEPTDGLTYPGFTMGGTTDLDLADAALLGAVVDEKASPPAVRYDGMRASFEYDDPAMGTGLAWEGVYARS